MKGAANIHVLFRPSCTPSPAFPSIVPLSLFPRVFKHSDPGRSPACKAVRHRGRIELGKRVSGSAAVLRNAQPGDEILAAEGVYVPSFDRDGNPVNGAARTFALKSGVKLFGGFPAEGSPLLQDRDPRAFPTVLTGDLFGDDQVDAEGKAIIVGQNAFHVVYAAGVDETAVPDGFVISGGRADGQGEDAVRSGCNCTNASPVIELCFSGIRKVRGGE